MCLFSGVRPSSGAAPSKRSAVPRKSEVQGLFELGAPEDGRTPLNRYASLAGLLLVVILAGCTSSHYRKSADKEAYRAIRAKSSLVTNMDSNFHIEQTNSFDVSKYAVSTSVEEFLGPEGEHERGARVLKLEDALGLATDFSRNYQTRKEQLFASALSLTLSRHAFAPIFSGNVTPTYSVQNIDVARQTNVVLSSTNVILGQTNIVLGRTNIIPAHWAEDRKITTKAGIGADWLIRDVGKISTAFMTDFTRFVTGDPRAMFSSELNATFTRPLLRDAGFQQEKEALIQSERRLLYDLRDFTRFRKNLSVQIATAYYGVLRNRDTARNSYLNLQSSRKNAERSRALAKEGRITQSDLGRLEQQELSTEGTWIDSIRNYKLALDNFKRQLGVNVDTQVVLDDRDLQNLQILDPNLRLEDSVRIALSARLDYLTLKDELEDTERKAKLAANALLPQIDLTGFAAIDSNPNDNRGFPLPNPKRYSYSGGLTIDPGLDRKSQRNDYRNALINRDQAARNIADKQDEITVQVNDSWRTLDQAKRTYEISEIGVKLAERRVEEQNLLAELGRAKAQDQVDAQNALIDSKNQLTAALVNHTVARLQLWENVEVLYIKDNGQWEEIQHAKAQ